MSNPIGRLIGQANSQRQINEQQARQSASIGAKRQRRTMFRIQVDAVTEGEPTTYTVTVLSGSADAPTSRQISGVLGTTDEAQFSVGDKAVMLWAPPEPATLISGGGGGGTLIATGVWQR